MDFRINGFTQMKAFYSWAYSNQDKNVRTTHIALYMFLINQNNRNNWIEWFKCPFDLAMGGSAISNKKTYYSTLANLEEWGFINYQKGVNNFKAPLIRLAVLFDTATVPQSEPQVLPQYIPLPSPLLLPQLYKNIKLLTNNIETITYNIEKIIEFLKSEDSKGVSEKTEKDSLFENFWNLYPNKIARAKCEKEFTKLSEVEKQKISDTINDFVKHKPFPEYHHPNPLTYLSQKRWEDDIPKFSATTNQVGAKKDFGKTNQVTYS